MLAGQNDMQAKRYTQIAAIILISVTMAIVDARKCLKADRNEGQCVIRRDRREKKPKKSAAPHWKNGPPKDNQVVVREGSDETLNCAMRGSPNPEFTWMINGKLLNTTKSKKFRQKKGRLMIDSVQLDDATDYTCVAKNKHGSLNYTYFIKVLENMPLNDIDVEDRPENQTAHIGDTVIFMCRSHDWPKPRVHWARKTNNNNLIETIESSSTEPDVLVMHNVTKDDTGRYICFIGNDIVQKEFTATLTVIEEGESLPFEPPCSLHIRREILVDQVQGCKSAVPVEIRYCMGSCGRSYYVPHLMTSDIVSKKASAKSTSVSQTCKCCVGIMDGLRIVELDCPLGGRKRGFYTLLRECQCQACSVSEDHLPASKTKT
ncbi:hypothetical protein BsWGS_26978 [Bradybaena similaris]